MREIDRKSRKSGTAVLTMLLALILAWPSSGLGDGLKERKTAFKAGGGLAYHTGQSFSPGFLYRAGFFTLVSPRLGLEVLLAGSRVQMDTPLAGLSEGQLATTQVLLSGQIRFPLKGRVVPYAILGIEFNFFNFLPDDEAAVHEHNVVDRFGPHLGAGLDWALSDRIALTVDARHNLIKTWVEELPREGTIGEVNPDEVDQVKLSTLTFSLGLKFYF